MRRADDRFCVLLRGVVRLLRSSAVLAMGPASGWRELRVDDPRGAQRLCAEGRPSGLRHNEHASNMIMEPEQYHDSTHWQAGMVLHGIIDSESEVSIMNLNAA